MHTQWKKNQFLVKIIFLKGFRLVQVFILFVFIINPTESHKQNSRGAYRMLFSWVNGLQELIDCLVKQTAIFERYFIHIYHGLFCSVANFEIS